MRDLLVAASLDRYDPPMDTARVEREQHAYDKDDVWTHCTRWHRRFPHVFSSPNTVHCRQQFFSDLLARSAGRRVLEIGCGHGWASRKVHQAGARQVLGIDVAQSLLDEAQRHEVRGQLEFRQADATAGIDGQFDVIFALGVLHHLEDYRGAVLRLYEENLSPGGSMLFVEPLADNWLLKAYRLVSPKAHTPDEFAFGRSDLRWFFEQFSHVWMLPRNYLSLPCGIVSSFLFRRADNALLRACDRVDRWLACHVSWLTPRFRQVNITVQKPGTTA